MFFLYDGTLTAERIKTGFNWSKRYFSIKARKMCLHLIFIYKCRTGYLMIIKLLQLLHDKKKILTITIYVDKEI